MHRSRGLLRVDLCKNSEVASEAVFTHDVSYFYGANLCGSRLVAYYLHILHEYFGWDDRILMRVSDGIIEWLVHSWHCIFPYHHGRRNCSGL